MPYNPKDRPVFLGNEQDRTNPNRLKVGVLSVADDNQNQIPVVAKPPNFLEQALHIGKIIAIVLVGLAASVLGLASQGVAIPAWLSQLAVAITGLGAALGIASGGIKSPSKPEPGPDELK